MVLFLRRFRHHRSYNLYIHLDARCDVKMEATKEERKPSTHTDTAYHVEYVARPGLALLIAGVRGNGLQDVIQNQQRCQSLQASPVFR